VLLQPVAEAEAHLERGGPGGIATSFDAVIQTRTTTHTTVAIPPVKRPPSARPSPDGRDTEKAELACWTHLDRFGDGAVQQMVSDTGCPIAAVAERLHRSVGEIASVAVVPQVSGKRSSFARDGH
jgi:hypothetical protein